MLIKGLTYEESTGLYYLQQDASNCVPFTSVHGLSSSVFDRDHVKIVRDDGSYTFLSDIVSSYPSIIVIACIMKEWGEFISVHKMKKRAKGMPVVTIPVILFCDDTSGNISKKWNKFIEWNLIIAGS